MMGHIGGTSGRRVEMAETTLTNKMAGYWIMLIAFTLGMSGLFLWFCWPFMIAFIGR